MDEWMDAGACARTNGYVTKRKEKIDTVEIVNDGRDARDSLEYGNTFENTLGEIERWNGMEEGYLHDRLNFPNFPKHIY